MKKRYFILSYLVLIAIGAYLLADTVNLFVGSHLEASVELPQKPLQRIASRPTVDYQAIVEGNIFSSKLRGKQPVREEGSPSVVETPASPLNIRLIGTVVGNAESFAVIEDKKTREQSLYHLGDRIGETGQGEKEGKIVKIKRNEVIILRRGQKEVLKASLTDSTRGREKGSRRMVSKLPKLKETGIRQVSEGKWVLDRREVDAAIDNLPKLLTKARIIPNFSDGKPNGFKIFSIKSGSLYAKIGLQNGDIIQQINGVAMKDPQNFMRVFQQLKDESNITIDLVRNNRRETFGYEIR